MPIGQWLDYDATNGVLSYFNGSNLVALPYGLSTVQTRVQLADLGSGTTTGAVAFGDSIAANTVVLGGFLHLNADPTSGGTVAGINVSLAQGAANMFTSVDIFGETGAPKYLTPFSNAADFTGVPLLSSTAGQPAYQIAVTGPGADLNQITAFDITLGLIVSTLTVTVP